MQANSTTAVPIKDIRYSDGEWHVYVDGEYRGSRRSSFLAEELANEVAYDIILATAPVASDDEMSDWQCATCQETDPTQRDPERPESCRWCPERTATTRTLSDRITVSWYLDGCLRGSSHYQNTEQGAAAAARKLARLAEQGYVLRDPEEETGPQEEGGPGGYPPPDDHTVAGLTIRDLADVAWLCERHDYTLEDALAAVVAFNAATEPEPPTPPAAPAARPVTREAA